MSTILLILIYVMFIGLGTPDSAIGTAWPAMYHDIGATLGQQNLITITASICTTVMSYFSAKLINKLGTGPVTTISTALTALGLVGTAFSHSLWFSVLCAIPAGLGAGAIDSALNNYMAVHYKSSHMNFLHSFYGLGVLASPFLFSMFLDSENGWRHAYLVVFGIQILITICSLIALPFWNKVQKLEPEEEQFTPRTLTFKQMAKIPALRWAWVLFFSSVSLEFTCGYWGASYLVESINLTESLAAQYVTFYYLGIALSRFLSGFISTKVKERNIIFTGFIIIAVSMVLLIMPLPPIIKAVGLLLVGLGNGPIFPNLTCLVPKIYGKDVSQSIIGSQMVLCNLGICLVPPLFGVIADFLTIDLFPYFLALFFLLMLISGLAYKRLVKKGVDLK